MAFIDVSVNIQSINNIQYWDVTYQVLQRTLWPITYTSKGKTNDKHSVNGDQSVAHIHYDHA